MDHRRHVGTGAELITLGCSLGAYHAVHFAFQRADLAPLAIGLSGNYDVVDVARLGRARRRDLLRQPRGLRAAPARRPPRLAARRGCRCCWSCGQGAWETHPTGVAAVDPARWQQLLQDKGIRCELDLWGHDVSHDWPWWQRQLAHHLPRFV